MYAYMCDIRYMSICMRICVHIFIYRYMYAYMCAYMITCMVYVCIYIIYAYMCAYMCAYIDISVNVSLIVNCPEFHTLWCDFLINFFPKTLNFMFTHSPRSLPVNICPRGGVGFSRGRIGRLPF